MNASIHHDGSTRLAIKGLDLLDPRILQAAGTGLSAALQRISGISQRKFLSGPRPGVLDVVTTRLRGSMTTAVAVEGDRIIGRIGTNIPYGPVHEFGLVGRAPIKVRQHERGVDRLDQVVKQTVTKNGRRRSDLYRFDKQGKIIGYKRTLLALAQKRKQEHEIEVQTVRAHERKDFKYRGRPFLRPAIEHGKPIILDEIKKRLAALNPA